MFIYEMKEGRLVPFFILIISGEEPLEEDWYVNNKKEEGTFIHIVLTSSYPFDQ